MIGQLKACYWPNAEPKVVVVLAVSPAEECLVQIVNGSVLTGAHLEHLREFDRAEFERARNAWWRDEYARRSERCGRFASEPA